MRSRYTSGFALELIEQSIEVVAVEDEACALSHRDKMRAPSLVERASFDADVGNRLGMSESSPHEKAATEGQGGSRMASRPGGRGVCMWLDLLSDHVVATGDGPHPCVFGSASATAPEA